MFLFTQIMRSMMTAEGRKAVEAKKGTRTFKLGASMKLTRQDLQRKSKKVTPLEAVLVANVTGKDGTTGPAADEQRAAAPTAGGDLLSRVRALGAAQTTYGEGDLSAGESV